MNENPNKKSGLKYFLFIGIPVLIVLAVLGFYYYITNPKEVLTTTIDTAYNNLEKLLNQAVNYNEETDKISVMNNIRFKTDANLYGYEELQDYVYNLNIEINPTEEYGNVTLGFQKDGKDILNATYYQIKNKLYLASNPVLEYPLDVTDDIGDLIKSENFTNNIEQNIPTEEITLEEAKLFLKRMKEIFVESLDNKYIEREKKDISIKNETIKTTKISYLLNKENQERTLDIFKEKLKNDETMIKILAKTNKKTEEEMKKILNSKEKEVFEDNYTINLYTEGLKQNVIQISILENNENIITYTNYQDNKMINIQDNTFTINKMSEEEIDIDYNLKENKGNGKLVINQKITSEHERTINTTFLYNSTKIKCNVNVETTINMNPEIEIPNITNAKKIEELNEEDYLNIFMNLENALKDTIFYQLIESNIM